MKMRKSLSKPNNTTKGAVQENESSMEVVNSLLEGQVAVQTENKTESSTLRKLKNIYMGMKSPSEKNRKTHKIW